MKDFVRYNKNNNNYFRNLEEFMRLVALEDVSIDKINHFKKSFYHTKYIIHGSNNLQHAKSLDKWMSEIKILNQKNYQSKVQTTHFALLDNNNEMVGISDLKHHLNSYLQKEGGNISYSISPKYHNKGYGKLILKETLREAKFYGFQSVLLTCRDDNYASKNVILANNGQLIRKLTVNQKTVEHYTIQLNNYN